MQFKEELDIIGPPSLPYTPTQLQEEPINIVGTNN